MISNYAFACIWSFPVPYLFKYLLKCLLNIPIISAATISPGTYHSLYKKASRNSHLNIPYHLKNVLQYLNIMNKVYFGIKIFLAFLGFCHSSSFRCHLNLQGLFVQVNHCLTNVFKQYWI